MRRGSVHGSLADTAAAGRSGRRRRLVGTAGRRELALFAAVYLLYDCGRWAFVGRPGPARAHARWVIHLERSLHVAVEGEVQRALGSGVSGLLLSNLYLAAQLVVLPGALIWLYRRSPQIYRRLRTTVAATWLISTPIFALYPVAPPRLAGIGIKDTVSHQSVVVLTGHSTLFYNPYAAVPSLHVGLAFAVGIAAAATLRRRWSRVLAFSWGPLVTVAVVATGNHYLLDVAAGLLVTALAYALSQLAGRVSIARGPLFSHHLRGLAHRAPPATPSAPRPARSWSRASCPLPGPAGGAPPPANPAGRQAFGDPGPGRRAGGVSACLGTWIEGCPRSDQPSQPGLDHRRGRARGRLGCQLRRAVSAVLRPAPGS
jgi:membrane-associated phospholipid phosphatase